MGNLWSFKKDLNRF